MKYNDLGYNCPEGTELRFSEQAWEYDCRPCNKRSDKMATVEQKYEAAVKMLAVMTEMLIEDFGDLEKAMNFAIEHRRRLEESTKDNPELFSAVMEVAHTLATED